MKKIRPKLAAKELTTVQLEAKRLIEERGWYQKDVGEKLNVSERTIGTWIKKFNWSKDAVVMKLRNKAKELVLEKGCTRKEAANLLAVSQRTMTEWSKKDKWSLGMMFAYPDKQQRRYVLTDFVDFVATGRPDLRRALSEFVDSYNDLLEHKKHEKL